MKKEKEAMKDKRNLAIALYPCGMASTYYDYEQSFVVGPSPIGMLILLFGILWFVFFMSWIIESLSHE